MKTIAITAEKTAIIEISLEDIDRLEALVNGAEVYARQLLLNKVPDYCEERTQKYYDNRIYPDSCTYWKSLYDLEVKIKSL